MPNLGRLAKRALAMSGGEIRTRLAQAAAARTDAWRHRLGLNPFQPTTLSPPPAAGHFFFDASAAPALATLWRQSEPAEAEAVVSRARQLLQRRYPLLGYEALDFGNPPDSRLDPVNHARAPHVPFPSVPYLDFQAVGDHKVTWEFSRHQTLVTLARAYLFTGDVAFANEALALWRLWHEQNPYPLGINWTSTLEVAFRTLSWMWLDHLLASTAVSKPALREEFAARIGHGAWYIERYLSTYFAPNTHLLGEAYALFAAGAVYRQFHHAARWAETGWRVVNEEARNQVFTDGFHFEQSTYYHVYALDFFLHARQLGARNGYDTSVLDEVIPRMCDALATISQAGQTPRFGDDDGGRLFDPARNRTAHLLDPLATGAVLYGNPLWKRLAPSPREETLWLTGAEAWNRFRAIPEDTHKPISRHFAQSGYITLAQPEGTLIADAGPHGWGNGGHGHADALSIQLIANGTPILTDPGTGSYPDALPARNQFRHTAAHSTVEVDSEAQAVAENSFKWSAQPQTKVELFISSHRGAVLIASHDGYTRLHDPLLHTRTIISLNGHGWFIHDAAPGRVPHQFTIHWQLPPGAQCEDQHGNWRIAPPGAPALHITSDAGGGWQRKAAQWSPAYGATEPCEKLTRECTAESLCAATALSLNGPHQLEKLAPAHGVVAWNWRTASGNVRLWLATQPGLWQSHGLATDARVAVCTNGQLWLAGATKAEIGGRALLSSTAVSQSMEWDLSPAEAELLLG